MSNDAVGPSPAGKAFDARFSMGQEVLVLRRGFQVLARSDMILLPQYRLEWSDDSCVWGSQPVWAHDGQHGEHAHGVHPLQPLSFDIVAPRSRLDRLWVRLATYRRRNTAHLWIELRAQSGDVLARGHVDPEAVRDGDFHEVIELGGVLFSPGAQYRVEISSPTALEENASGVWVNRGQRGRYELHRRLLQFRNDRLFATRAYDTSLATGNAVVVVPDPADARAAQLLGLLSGMFREQSFWVEQAAAPHVLWPLISDVDVVVFTDPLPPADQSGDDYDAMCFELYRRGICTIFADDVSLPATIGKATFTLSASLEAKAAERRKAYRRCRYIVDLYGSTLVDSDRPDHDLLADEKWRGRARDLRQLMEHTRKQISPKVCVVSVLHERAAGIDRFVDHIVEQSYRGDIELVLVSDPSARDEAAWARAASLRFALAGLETRGVTIVDNAAPLGRCASRLAAIRAVDADIYVLIECDSLINRDFIAAHVFEHSRPDVDVVISASSLEAHDHDASTLVRQLQAVSGDGWPASTRQDISEPDSFLLCATRSFSIKRGTAARKALLDEQFPAMTESPADFRWEDAALGYRLYAEGAIFRVARRAGTVRVLPGAPPADPSIVGGSLRNYELLLDLYPDLALVARRWAIETHGTLREAARRYDAEIGAPARPRATPTAEPNSVHVPRRQLRPLRILSYRWHIPYQYELHKLPYQFTLATGIGASQVTDPWRFDRRPLQPNVRFAAADTIDPRCFDVAILHFDEVGLASMLSDGIAPPGWGEPFQWLLGQPDLPKVAICHGGTRDGVSRGGGASIVISSSLGQVEADEREGGALVDAFSGMKVVCTSWQTQEDWAFRDSDVIWQAFDPQQFPAGRHDLEVLTSASGAAHSCGVAWPDVDAMNLASERGAGKTFAGVAIEPRKTNTFASANFRAYADWIGRFSFYLDTTRSRMPHIRGESMMTGTIPVSLTDRDIERFVVKGDNGFYSDDAKELRDWIGFTNRRPGEKARIALAARRAAMDVFNIDRFQTRWADLLTRA